MCARRDVQISVAAVSEGHRTSYLERLKVPQNLFNRLIPWILHDPRYTTRMIAAWIFRLTTCRYMDHIFSLGPGRAEVMNLKATLHYQVTSDRGVGSRRVDSACSQCKNGGPKWNVCVESC